MVKQSGTDLCLSRGTCRSSHRDQRQKERRRSHEMAPGDRLCSHDRDVVKENVEGACRARGPCPSSRRDRMKKAGDRL